MHPYGRWVPFFSSLAISASLLWAPSVAQAQAKPPAPVAPRQNALRRSTVSLSTDRSFCSGTWISPHVVLTAAHCVESFQPGTFFIVPSPDAVAPPAKLETGGYYIHPSYLAARQAAGDPRRNVSLLSADFAVVAVPRGMPAGAKVAILDFEHTVKANTLQSIAGYGQTGMRNGVPQGIGVLRSAEFKALYKFTNADAARDGKAAANPGAPATTAPSGYYWTLDGEGRAEVCRGDSGGPAFWVSDTTLMQFGVNSYIMAVTRDDLVRIAQIGATQKRGQVLLPLADLEFIGRLSQAATHIQDQGCSRLITVASVGEYRDWITARRDEIERTPPMPPRP